ncbi:MAG: hypothetical protein ACH37Z_04200 [Anaerolineae bacterium]
MELSGSGSKTPHDVHGLERAQVQELQSVVGCLRHDQHLAAGQDRQPARLVHAAGYIARAADAGHWGRLAGAPVIKHQLVALGAAEEDPSIGRHGDAGRTSRRRQGAKFAGEAGDGPGKRGKTQ